jgi:hypothetical protein
MLAAGLAALRFCRLILRLWRGKRHAHSKDGGKGE